MELQQPVAEPSNLMFPDEETLKNLDFRFNGKEGHFNLQGQLKMPENFIVFAPIGFGQVFGNIGKNFKDTNFLSIIAYSESGAFGKQLIRLFLKGIHNGTAQKFATLLQLLQSKGIFPYKCLFKAEIYPIRKGDYDVHELSFDYDNSAKASEFCGKVWAEIPSINWYNDLPYHKPNDDVICVWKNTIKSEKGKMQINRTYPFGENTFFEVMALEREKQLKKIEEYRKELPMSKAKAIAAKYLGAAK